MYIASPALMAFARPPDRPHGGPAPAGGAFVLDVVVDQREVVQQLDRRRRRQRRLHVAAGGLGAEQQQAGPHALAACAVAGPAAFVNPAQVVAQHQAVIVRLSGQRPHHAPHLGLKRGR
ncbi:MAG: hypothetical protein M5R40_01980 [Anaerolineae bacterium]|nr:hypothetical protein [Anaerolineae bacterium]